jgi:CheY-like chemotaxis protein
VWNIRILLVDDNKEIAEVLGFYFEQTGINYIVADNGKEGLEAIKRDEFDLILLDIAMPEFTGIDVIESLKKEGVLEKKNVVVLTASSHKATIEGLVESGVKEILKKPCSLDELKDLIDRYRHD